MTPTQAENALEAAEKVLASVDTGPWHIPSTGLHAVIAGACLGLPRTAWWVPGPRERAGAVLRGAAVERFADPAVGARPYRIAPSMGPHRALVAVGLASAGDPVLVHLGSASAAHGALAEAMSLAHARQATVVFLVAFHPLLGDAPLVPFVSPVGLASGLGVPTIEVDGSSTEAVRDAVATAISRRGPTLVLALLAAP